MTDNAELMLDNPTDVPPCCADTPWQAPPPLYLDVQLHAELSLYPDSEWRDGVTTWYAVAAAHWDADAYDGEFGARDAVASLASHCGRTYRLDEDDDDLPTDLVADLAAHGITHATTDYETLTGTVAAAELHRLDLHVCGDYPVLVADAHSQDLLDAIEPLYDRPDQFSAALESVCDPSFIADILVLSRVRSAPSVRSHGVGAQLAGTAIHTLITGPATLVVAQAAPLGPNDAARPAAGTAAGQQDQSWDGRRARLAAYWQRTLGLQPLDSDPFTLVWHTEFLNESLRTTLAPA